jgi:hypothetical protein
LQCCQRQRAVEHRQISSPVSRVPKVRKVQSTSPSAPRLQREGIDSIQAWQKRPNAKIVNGFFKMPRPLTPVTPFANREQTTNMNLGQTHCLVSQATTLDLWLENTKIRTFVIQGYHLNTEF